MAKELKALSVVVVEKTSKEGRRFMTAKVRAQIAYESGARVTLKSLNENVNLDVKLTKSTGITLPNKEGIYEIDFATAFEDTRSDCARPTLWVKPREAGMNVQFVYRKPLPADPNAPKSQNTSTVCILDEE